MDLTEATIKQIKAELCRRADTTDTGEEEPIESVASFLERKAEGLLNQARDFRLFEQREKWNIEEGLLKSLRQAVAKMNDLENQEAFRSAADEFRLLAPKTKCNPDELIDLVAGVVRKLTDQERDHRDSFREELKSLPWIARIGQGSYQVFAREDA